MNKILVPFVMPNLIVVLLLSILFSSCENESPIDDLTISQKEEIEEEKETETETEEEAESEEETETEEESETEEETETEPETEPEPELDITSDYFKLEPQERADLARFLGWVWADGIPAKLNDVEAGAKYKGSNPKYSSVVNRLAEIIVDGETNPYNFRTGEGKWLPEIWDYWKDAIPGYNPNDPQLLKDAVRNPNFLVGVIEAEGQQFHSDATKPFYITDHSFYPSHPDPQNKKSYEALNFGPERANQMFLLLGGAYGFTKTEMHFEGQVFVYDTQGCEAVAALRERHALAKSINTNDNPNDNDGFTVRLYINPVDFATLRTYGYFNKNQGNYRTPAPDDDLTIITGLPKTHTIVEDEEGNQLPCGL